MTNYDVSVTSMGLYSVNPRIHPNISPGRNHVVWKSIYVYKVDVNIHILVFLSIKNTECFNAKDTFFYGQLYQTQLQLLYPESQTHKINHARSSKTGLRQSLRSTVARIEKGA